MINQLTIVLVILFNFTSIYAQSSRQAETADMKMPIGKAPTKSDFEAEVKKYKTLYNEFQKREDVNMDPYLVGMWNSSASNLERGMAVSAEKYKEDTLAEYYFKLQAFNRSAERNLSDTERILVLECCHKIKDGKICDSLKEDRKRDLKKCQGAH